MSKPSRLPLQTGPGPSAASEVSDVRAEKSGTGDAGTETVLLVGSSSVSGKELARTGIDGRWTPRNKQLSSKVPPVVTGNRNIVPSYYESVSDFKGTPFKHRETFRISQ